MTLVEILVVVFIIVVLLGMIMPMSHQGGPARKIKAKMEIADLTTAIQAYEQDYGVFPLADYSTNEDLTLGIDSSMVENFLPINGTRLIATNSDLIVALMDMDAGANSSHKLNPKKIRYLNAKLSGDTNSPGVGTDYQYRDAWGKPYIISLDANQDGQCADYLYCRQKVSQTASNSQLGLNGLFNSTDTNGNHFLLHQKVMVWSAGPDKKISAETPAHTGVNKDNILSWE